MGADGDEGLDVWLEDEHRRLEPGQSLTIGRRADLVVDPTNRRLHRVLARLTWSGGWWIENLGRTITLVVSDLDGSSYARISPGDSVPLPFPNTALSFSAGAANYRLTLRTTALARSAGLAPMVEVISADRTEGPDELSFNDEQLALLAELAAPRLAGPVSAADLPTSRELARALGWSLSKCNRKLDHLCAKLDRAGVTGVSGRTGASASERRLVLANFAVESGLVVRPRP